MGDGGVNAVGEGVNQSHVLFDRFVQATTCKGTLKAFQELCDFLELKPNEYCVFYHKLKSKLNYWKAKALWAKLDKRASHKEYKKGRACANTKCLIIGAGPCGLRTAIELGFLGAKVVLLEKRDAFSRNNVLHLWPFTIHDLRGLGAKKFYGKFCAGAIDHISIRQLQLMLLKVALLLGIEIHVNVEFKGLIEPPEDQENERIGWRAEVHPRTHPVNELEFDVIIGADGRRNTLSANFINRNTTAEAKVEEISGVAFIFNQKFFQDLREATGIDLENIVYYKDDTHYFVMTAKKQSLLEKGVILHPFWPMGTGIARGFLAGLDAAWMVRSWAHGSSPLEVLAERESIYRLLPQTTPENVSKNFSQYSVDPTTRYPNISLHQVRPSQVQHLLDTGEIRDLRVDMENVVNSSTPKLTRNEILLEKQLQESIVRSSKLLNWCQRQTEGYRGVSVSDLTTCWKSGLALCALIHCYRPDLIDFDSLDEKDVEKNNQLAFDVAEKEFGISPIMTGKEMSVVVEPDKLSMVMYLSQFYEMFKDTVPPSENHNLSPEEKAALIASTKSPISFFSKLGQSIAISRKRNPKDKKEKELDGLGKRRKTSQAGQSEDEELKRVNRDDRPSIATALAERKIDSAAAVNNNNKVKVMATQLLAKFEENAPTQSTGLKRQRRTQLQEQMSFRYKERLKCQTLPIKQEQGSLRKEFPQNIGGSDVCFFCRKRVYVMERLSAEGKFFHRSCFKCDYCGTTLRLSSYAFDVEDGKFYCKPHYCYRLSGLAQRKRPAAPAPVNAKEPQVLAVTPNTVDAPGQSITSQAPVELRPSVTEVNGVTESSVAKRLKGTPERIELENYRLSMMREEELQEVPEETLAEHNLSSVLDKATDIEEGSSSSESDMEEEDEEPEGAGPSDLGGVPWKEAVELHAKLKGESDPGAAEDNNGLHDGEMDEDEEEEEEEDEDEEEEEEESSDEPCEEDDDPEAEAGSPDFEPGTEKDQEKTSANPKELIVDVVLSPIQKPALPIEEVKDVSPVMLVKSPGARFFSEPYLLDDVKPNIPLPQSPDAKSPYSPAAQIIALSPICSQPVPQPETTSLKSPVQHEPCACSPTGNPLSPICTQSQPCNEPPSPLSTSSPVRTQPVPAITSTPLAKPASEKRTNDPLKDSVPEESPIKKTDIIEEFWLKSAEIRKSLGLSPLDRSKPSVEKSIVKTPTPGSPSPKSYTPEDLSEEQKPSFTGRSIIRRINITLEGQVISPVEPKSNGSEKKDLSSSSGLGLNGSVTTSQTVASDSYNNSDSTMLTPPSSPPPLPPNEEPASLQTKRSQVSWDNLLEATEEPKPETTPPKPKTPVSPPQPKPVVAPVQDPGTNPPVVMRVKEPNKPRREEVRKSFVECIDEIPFADDVEDTYDDRTPDTSVLEKFYTPPTSKVNREKPPLHLALAMENGKPNIPSGVSRTAKGPQRFSLEAKEIAEERMRAREKSVKSQALKDAMSKQLTKMKESDAAKGAVAKVAWNVPETTGKNKKQSNTPKDSAVKALESKKQTETLPDRFFTTPTSKTLDSSVTSSESSTGGKSKKRSSLFSPRKNKKEKKAKNERLSGTEETPPKHKSLWKTVFSGYKKDKKKKDDKSCPSTSSSSTTEDSGKKKESPLDRSSDLRLRRNLSFSEDSDLSCDDVLERSSQKSKGDRHVDLFDLVSDLKKDAIKEEKSKEKDKDRAREKGKRVTKKGKERSKERENERRVKEKIVKMKDVEKEKGKEEEKTYTEEELNAKLTRRVQKAARRQAKQEELKRLHRAQIIQRQLEQVEEKQRQLEERGVAVEKALRGEADYWGESNYSEILDLHLGGMYFKSVA
ncbi:hypothetical protein cypCar_00010703 [Cyprinus carpio]|nr:hypothetical protein cypCar_00010703 [Cyprinus carpio]